MREGLVFDLDSFAVHDGPGLRLAVYLKGCPLRCAWCHSPESQRGVPELIFVQDRCTRCGACQAACPQAVHGVTGDEHRLDRTRCVACGACARACVRGALAIKGQSLGSDEVVARAVRLKPFFRPSGGGITLTGGEVTAQVTFAEAVLHGCRTEGIHTAIETCGACTWEALARLLPYVDLVLYDLKLMDEEAHRRWTGSSNRAILDNAERLARRRAPVRIRTPLIPGVTDTEENLGAIREFVRRIGLREIECLPYNQAAGAKWEWLGREYTLRD